MIIKQATTEYLDNLVKLFDSYRVFYKQPSDLKSAKTFLKERLTKQDSIIYIAFEAEVAIGFMQLYSLFSSVSM